MKCKLILMFGMLMVVILVRADLAFDLEALAEPMPENNLIITVRGSNWDEVTNPDYSKTRSYYVGDINIEYKDRYIPFEDYLSVSNDNGKIKFETLDGKKCFIELDYKLKDQLSKASPTIEITKNRGSYYFTTDIGENVTAMAYKLDCDATFVDNKLYILDIIQIDFNEAKEKQNITTVYNLKANKLIFYGNDLKVIDPIIQLNSTEVVEDVGLDYSWLDQRYAYIQWNTSGYIPSGQVIDDVNLHVYVSADASDDDTRIYLVPSQSCDLTNDNVATIWGYSTQNTTTLSWATGTGWRDWNITNIYQEHYSLDNSLLTIKIDDPDTTENTPNTKKSITATTIDVGDYADKYFRIHSSEGTNKFTLSITYHSAGYETNITNAAFNDTSLSPNEHTRLNVSISSDGTLDTVWTELVYPNSTAINYTMNKITEIGCEAISGGVCSGCANETTCTNCSGAICNWSSMNEDIIYEDFDQAENGADEWVLTRWEEYSSSTYCVNDANDDCVRRTNYYNDQMNYGSNIDLSNCQAGTLYVSGYFYDYSVDNGEYLRMYLSSDGGSNYNNTNSINGGLQGNGLHPFNFSVSDDYISSQFRVGFKSVGLDSSEYWYLDDIKVTCLVSSCSGTLDCSNYLAENTCNNCSQCNWTDVWQEPWYSKTFTDTSATGTYNITHIFANITEGQTNQTDYTDLYFAVTGANAAPIIIANATSPAVVYPDTDFKFNMTATDDDNATLSGYAQFYINGVESSLTGSGINNNTNSFVGALAHANFNAGDNLIAEFWVTDGIDTTIKENTTQVTVQSSDTCTCPSSGNWNIQCSDNCDIQACNMQTNNVLLNGTGNILSLRNITNATRIRIQGGCIVRW